MAKRKPRDKTTTEKPPPVPCPDCGGRGWRAVATDEVKCARCDGTGKA
jgi:DnaJ-class molecular chaperone